MKSTDAESATKGDKPQQETVEDTTAKRADDDDFLAKGVLADDDLDAFGAQKKKTDPAEIRLVRKLDLWIMPILWVMYFLNFLDRNAMINGKLDTLSEDLGLKGTQYNTCVSILFVGYLGGQVPSNMLLSRVRPSWYLAGFMTAWSVVSLLTYMAHDFHTMLVCRLLLGITESPFYPGALYLLSMFYTRKEIAARISIFYTGTMAASAFAGLMCAPIFTNLGGKRGLAGWQWVFIIQGAISIFVALLSFFILPNTPKTTWWLTPEERELASRRIAQDVTQRRETETTVWTGLREACADYRTWLFCLLDCLHLSANGFKNFVPTLVKELGLDTTRALVLTCPPYILAGFTTIFLGWNSGRMNERAWHTTISKTLAIAGFAICVGTLNMWVRYFGVILFVSASYGVNTIVLGWVASVLGQSDEKKAVALALCNTFGNLSAIYTPYLWPDSDAPRFVTAMSSSIAFSAGVIACAWAMRFILQRDNKRLREANPEATNFYVY